MEQDQNASLFGLGIDNISKGHLSEAAKWAKFLAICGFIFIGLMVVYGILMSIMIVSMTSTMGQVDTISSEDTFKGFMGIGMIIFYIVFAVIAFFPYYFLLRFANKMKGALISNDQELLNGSFQNLKILYRYAGILTIISLVLIIFGILSMAATVMMAGN
ncbi:MAG TPA: hypothetical protein VF144_01775 [Chitinophagaceae bacterium]